MSPTPPIARRVPRTDVVHGDVRVDDYFWMRDRDDPAVTAYLTAENAYTDEIMKPTVAFQESLYAEMLARIKEDDQTVPYRRRGFFYYSRTETGKQYPIYCRKAGSLEAPEQVMLDLNALAVGHPFLSLGSAAVTDDGRRLAYTTDVTGFREYTLHVKDLETGDVLPDEVEKVSAVAWAADGQTLFYVTEDEAKRPYRLYRHRFGTAAPDLLFEETDALFRLHVGRSRSLAYLFMISGSFTKRGSLSRRSVVTTAGRSTSSVSSPASTSRVTRAVVSVSSTFDANVACGRSHSAASIWPVWLLSSSMACLPRMTRNGCSFSTSLSSTRAAASGSRCAPSVTTCSARCAPMASALRSVACASAGAMVAMTTSSARPRSLIRNASSTAIWSKGLMLSLTPSSITPVPSGFTRMRTL